MYRPCCGKLQLRLWSKRIFSFSSFQTDQSDDSRCYCFAGDYPDCDCASVAGGCDGGVDDESVCSSTEYGDGAGPHLLVTLASGRMLLCRVLMALLLIVVLSLSFAALMMETASEL